MPHFNRHGARPTLAALILLLLCAGGSSAQRLQQGDLSLDGIPPVDASVAAALPRYLESRPATCLDWLADGSMLVATRFGDTEQVYRLRAPLGAPEQLTFYPEPVGQAAAQFFSADAFVFIKDHAGNGIHQIYLQRFADHSVAQLSDGSSDNHMPVWAHDGKRIAFASNRGGGNFAAYVQDTGAPGSVPRLIAGGADAQWEVLDWSLDDRRLLLQRKVSKVESYLYVVELDSGEVKPIDPPLGAHAPPAFVRAARFAPDGRGVMFIGDRGSEFQRLRYADLYSSEVHDLTPEFAHDFELFDASADGRYLAYVYNDAGVSRLNIVDQQKKLELAPSDLTPGVISSLKFDRTGKRLAFSSESAFVPRTVSVISLDGMADARWTLSELGPIDTQHTVAPLLQNFTTWDQANGQPRQLPAYVYWPTMPGPHPVLVLLHDGPQAQYRPGFEPFVQYLVNELGFAVVAPNVRGSSGYGRSFAALDDGELREDALRDVAALLVWIGLQHDLDHNRVLLMGTGYGGYLSLAALAQYGDRLRGAVDVAGVTDLVSWLDSSSGYRRAWRRVEFGDERDLQARAFLQRVSPFNNAEGIQRPVLIVQGLNDTEVPASESEQMLARLRQRAHETWYLGARAEGHEFGRKQDLDAYYGYVASFLARWSKP